MCFLFHVFLFLSIAFTWVVMRVVSFSLLGNCQSSTNLIRKILLLNCDILELARKLCYGKLIENKTGRLEGSVQIKKAEVINSPKKAVRKPKTDSNDFHHNDNIKVPHASCVVQYNDNGIGGNSGRSCPESAILFSQQQLRDIESITAKLTKQLQFMKDIAEETLQYPAASLRYSQNEVN